MSYLINPVTGQKVNVDGNFSSNASEPNNGDGSPDSEKKARKNSGLYGFGVACMIFISSWCVYAGIHGLIYGPGLFDESEVDDSTFAQKLLEKTFCRGGQRSDFCD